MAAGGAGAAGGRSCRSSASWAPATPAAQGPLLPRFAQRLRTLGWIDGRTVTIEYRWAEGRTSAMPRSPPSSSRSTSTSSSPRELWRSRRQAGHVGHSDRVRGGGRPGWHRPGREPGATRRQRHRSVGSAAPTPPLSDSSSCARSSPAYAGWRSWPMSTMPAPCWTCRRPRRAARSLGLDLVTCKFDEPRISRRPSMASRAAQKHFMSPTIHLRPLSGFASIPWRWAPVCRRCRSFGGVETGGLMSYGPNDPDQYRRAADFVDKNSTRRQAGRHPGRTADQI